jgi:hypothetical protein
MKTTLLAHLRCLLAAASMALCDPRPRRKLAGVALGLLCAPNPKTITSARTPSSGPICLSLSARERASTALICPPRWNGFTMPASPGNPASSSWPAAFAPCSLKK